MNQFNLRVYGFIINENQELLLSDEYRYETFFTKFPGGGVEYGEGITNALHREFKEELDTEIESCQLIYFNDYFQESVFIDGIQVTCFYYLVKCKNIQDIGTKGHSIPFKEEGEKQRWVKIQDLKAENLTFKTDRIAFEKLKTFLNF